MKNNIFFSIILPTYNRSDKINRAIDSVIQQTFTNWELIIIDNNSSDNTKEIVNNYNNKKISFYKIQNNGVIAKSRNFGIQKSNGIFLSFLDSDDWWDSKKLEFVYEESKKGYPFIYHNHFVYSPKRFIKKRKIYCKHFSKPIFSNLIKLGPSFATSSVSVNKSEFKKIQYFDDDKKYIAWEDFDAWLKLSMNVSNFQMIDKTLTTICLDETNFLNDKLKLININSFLNKYLSKTDEIPTWCLYNILVAKYNLGNYEQVKKNMIGIKFSMMNLFQKLNFLRILIAIFFKKNFF